MQITWKSNYICKILEHLKTLQLLVILHSAFRLKDTNLVAGVIVSLSSLFTTQIHVCVLIMAESLAPRKRDSCQETALAMPSTSSASPGKHYRVIPLFITLAP